MIYLKDGMANDNIDIWFCFVLCVYRIRRPFIHLVTLSILKPEFDMFSGRVFPPKKARGWEMIVGRESGHSISG